MPLFAFANAGVPIEAGAFTDSVAMAIVVGLFVGKPIAIALFSWFAVRTGLALSQRLLLVAKIGILTGSALCAVLGLALLLWLLPRPAQHDSAAA